jgi:hypothetical protein
MTKTPSGKWAKREHVLLTVVASKCPDVLARLERDVAANGYGDEPWICQRGVPIGTRAALLSQGDGVRGICAFGICINAENVPAVFDGRAVNEKLFRFDRFVDPTHRVLVSYTDTRAIIGKTVGQQSSGCRLALDDYERLLTVANSSG